MLRTIAAQQPDLVIHLGDYVRDAEKLRTALPQQALVNVRGNCDPGANAEERAEFEVCGVQVFACHGHRYGVKTSLDALLNAGYFSGAGLVLFGHTHIARHLCISGMEVVNPGSAQHSCAVIDIEPETGKIEVRLQAVN